MTLHEHITHWRLRDPDPTTQNELNKLEKDTSPAGIAILKERFSGRLAFGTAGLRGLVGVGPTRMNRLVIQETSAGLGQYLIKHCKNAHQRGIVVGYDGRNDSFQFAQDSAHIFSLLGFTVYLSDRPTPTPLCAFALTHYAAAAAVVVTASHNPPEYNGYKVYWENGAQIIPPHDNGIAEEIIIAAKTPLPINNESSKNGDIRLFGDTLYALYQTAIAEQTPPLAKNSPALTIAYTPLHGVGAPAVEQALANAGFSEVHTVASQREPDGNFPTVRFPNPEEPGAMDAVLALAKKYDAHLVMANDPDADRLAIALPTTPLPSVDTHPASDASNEGYTMLSGDQIGVLLADAMIENLLKSAGNSFDPNKYIVANSIVSSRMLAEMANYHQLTHLETLTGFKWIANGGLELESAGKTFLFGYEEALGYTIKGIVRDKDGISALLMFALYTAQLLDQGTTLWQRLEFLYRRHGLYLTQQRSLPLGNQNGKEAFLSLQKEPLTEIAGQQVIRFIDLNRGIEHSLGGSTPTSLPTSDVLIYHLADKSRVIVRPSGTEPKLKCYYEVIHPMADKESYQDAKESTQTQLDLLLKRHQDTVAALPLH